jgi:hypothetical protein
MTVGDCSRRLCLVPADSLLLGTTRLALAQYIPVYLNCLVLGKMTLVLTPCILVYLNCLLVDMTQEVLVLSIHLDVARSHCSQSYFATPSLISRVNIPDVAKYSHGQNLFRQTRCLFSP